MALLELSDACSTLLQLLSDDPAVSAAAAAGGPALDRRRHGLLLQVARMQLHLAFVGLGLKVPATQVAAMHGLARALRLAAVGAPMKLLQAGAGHVAGLRIAWLTPGISQRPLVPCSSLGAPALPFPQASCLLCTITLQVVNAGSAEGVGPVWLQYASVALGFPE
jgi:hypothetical protein